MKEFLADTERTYGSDSPKLTDDLICLGNAHLDAKQYDQADAVYKRAISINENGLGLDPPVLIKVLTAYAALLKTEGETK